MIIYTQSPVRPARIDETRCHAMVYGGAHGGRQCGRLGILTEKYEGKNHRFCKSHAPSTRRAAAERAANKREKRAATDRAVAAYERISHDLTRLVLRRSAWKDQVIKDYHDRLVRAEQRIQKVQDDDG